MSVIIPARNESVNIGEVVRSILRTTYEPIELLVVDDRSTDDTAAIVAAAATEDPRVRLIPGIEVPPGWFGKPWACRQGYQSARGELLLFTDADTRHEPALLEHAVGALLLEKADLVTVAPHQRCVTLWERLVMPQVWLLLILRFPPGRVNRARHTRDVIANGQFILVTRTSYEAVGTHEAVRDEIAEDLALAQKYHLAGRKIHFAFAEHLMETRMYRGLGHLVEGWSKNLYLGGRRSFPEEPILRAAVPLVLAGAMLYWLAPLALMLLAAAARPDLLPGATAALALATLFWMVFCVGMGIPAGYGLGFPLGAALMLFIVARSTWRGARRIEWKGRTYGKVETAGTKR